MKLCPTCRVCFGDDTFVCPTDNSNLKHQRPGTQQIANRYFIQRLLGSGGTGAVYLAKDVVLNRSCALKLERLDQRDRDPMGKLRLRREALIACQIDHRHIVKVYDFGTNPVTVEDERGAYTFEEIFIAMQFLHGETLHRFLARNGRLAPGDALIVARQAAQALAELHARGLVHRDIKPSNLMLTIDPRGKLVVKVIDLGAVKLDDPNTVPDYENLTTGFIGSPKYASPEMCNQHVVDARSDLYSLGLVLYEMVAGRPAFDDAEFSDLLYKQAREAPPPLLDAPKGLVQLINDTIEKNPERRIQSARDFIRRCRELERVDESSRTAGARVIAALRESGYGPAPTNLDLGFADEETKFAEPANNSVSGRIWPISLPDQARDLVEGTVTRLGVSGISVSLSNGTSGVILWQDLKPENSEDFVVTLRPGQPIRARVKEHGAANRVELTSPVTFVADESLPPVAPPDPSSPGPLPGAGLSPPPNGNSRVSENVRIALTVFMLLVLIGASAVLLGRRFLKSTARQADSPVPEVRDSKPVDFTAGIGDQAETTTDCNLRATFSAGSAKVGLVKKGSRVQILDQYRNWRRVRILRRAGIPDSPKSEDEGWIDGTNLRAVETDQI